MINAHAAIFGLVSLLLAGAVAAAPPTTPAPVDPAKAPAAAQKSPPPPAGPVFWKAELMRMEQHAHHVFLDGNVHITRSDLLVLGEKAVADLAAEETPPPEPVKPTKSAAKNSSKKKPPEPVAIPGLGEQVQRFVIDGAVHVERADRQADGDHAIYDAAGQTLTLEGPASARPYLPEGSPLPVLRDEKEVLAGIKILMKLDSDEILVAQPHMTLLRSQAPGEGQSGPAVPARVDAKTLLVDQDRHVMKFRDEVVLHRADLVVAAPRMIARSGEDGEIDQLEMNGGVQLHQGQRHAVGNNAVYDAKHRTVVLTGNPRLYDRGDEMTGDRIEMSLDTDQVRVTQARGQMHPDAHSDEQTAAAKPGAKSSAAKSSASPAAEGGK